MKKRIGVFVGVAVAGGFALSIFTTMYPYASPSFLGAGPFFTPSTTKEKLAETYLRAAAPAAARKVKVLVIPGHDDTSPGTSFKNLEEKDITLTLAHELVHTFKTNPAFEVTLARDEGGYLPALSPDLLNTEETRAFTDTHKAAMQAHIESGAIQRTHGVYHNDALPATALRLYAINKWANKNNFDLVVNIHFNDYPRTNTNTAGKYSGFALYVPEKQYSNALPSIEIGNYIQKEFEKLFPVSNHPQENTGVVEDQDLIALGAFNTLDAAVVLIEYDYIYSPAIHHEEVRPLVLKEYAEKTYTGIQNYFSHITNTPAKNLTTDEFVFATDLERTNTTSADVFLLQKALLNTKVYPPAPHTLHECPLSGKFGECTENAVKLFQERYSLPATGIVGPKTRALLNYALIR